MAGLQVLETNFANQPFHVLGFYENNFGAQGGTSTQVDACTSLYKVTFPQFAMDDVVGATKQPVWAWLEGQTNPGPSPSADPTWNFNKYLISKDGQLIGHWEAPEYWPEDPNDPTFNSSPIIAAINAELAK
jgi:glutathione peroxidase